jgi:hypothetical protein
MTRYLIGTNDSGSYGITIVSPEDVAASQAKSSPSEPAN